MSWTAPEAIRASRPWVGDEATILDAFLEFQRSTLLLKCAGLTAEQLADQAVPPSNLSLLGIVRHMVDVELTFFRHGLGGEQGPVPTVYARDDRPDAAFEEATADGAEADFARYAQECEAARKAVAGVSLEDQFLLQSTVGPLNLRRAYNMMIEEYARHNGHTDLLRQAIDGSTGI
ncbi:MAG TPA: DinB family protein [Streptosporangiaceae bacterium]|jgi:hypothetical protein|nr:DinB family protein [Streptosporangiaceae bacterium]